MGEPRTLSQFVTSSLSARSYIYQPWFATVSGTIGATIGRSSTSGQESTPEDPFASQERVAAKDRFLTGNARIDLFPRSRFPFEAHVDRNDSRIDNGPASTLGFKTQNFGFSQRYQPLSRKYSLSGGYDRHEQSGAGSRDKQDALVGDFSTRWKHHELSLGLSYSQARRMKNDERSQFGSFVGRHDYAPDRALSINSTFNATQTKEEVGAAPSDLAVLQWSSVGLYHPDGSKLTLSGGVRGLLLREAVTERAFDSGSVTVGASYELNRNARLSANGSATATNSNGTGAQSFGGSLSASWQGDTLEFKGLRYDWFVSGSAGSSLTAGAADRNETQTTFNTQIGHTLSRSWPVTAQSVLAFNAGQTLSANHSRSSERSHTEDSSIPTSSRTLLHTAGATWSANSDNRSGYARASYNDSRELGGGNGQFQMFNVQVSGTFAFDRNRSLSGDLTYQRTRQRAGDLFETGRGLVLGERTGSSGASGEISYRHQRLFGMPRLRFTSRLKLAQDVLDQPGTFATIADRETRLWENRLDWVVGRLETQLIFRTSQVDGRRHDFLMWRLQRNFGG